MHACADLLLSAYAGPCGKGPSPYISSFLNFLVYVSSGGGLALGYRRHPLGPYNISFLDFL